MVEHPSTKIKISSKPMCNKCLQFGLQFTCQNHTPAQAILGSTGSRAWILGINPREQNDLTVDELESYFTAPNPVDAHFGLFKSVSQRLSNTLGGVNGTACVDIVKCASPQWAFPSPTVAAIVAKCRPYLMHQLNTHRPGLIICNGIPACACIKICLPPPQPFPDGATHYTHLDPDGHETRIVFSGQVGRLDNFAKRRLGEEIERFLDELGLPPSTSPPPTPAP